MPVALPSLGTMLDAARGVVRRFPMVLAAAALTALAAILTNEEAGPAWMQDRLAAAASLGIPLALAATLIAERRLRSVAARVGVAGAVLLILVGVGAAWPDWSNPMRFARYLQLSIGFHLLVAFLPFAGLTGPGAFWQYNRTLFVRFLASAASTATLWAGLSLALLALDKLFGIDVPEDGYFRLWCVIAFIVNTWVFLGGVPADVEALEGLTDYPAGLRVFAQYTLLPLVSIYLVILTLYLGKVVVTWDWPSGWIGWLVSGVAVAGILTLLLVHPIAGREDQKWVAVFARDFWRAILPSVVMLWLALYQRVRQYGLTEPRYFLGLLSAWLFAVAVYYVVTRSARIRVIPASLCAVALLFYAGPWGAYAVSERSQAGRLRALLERNGALVNGRLQAPRASVPAADGREISAAARYLVENHGVSRLAPLIGDSLANQAARGRGDGSVRLVVRALGFEYAGRWSGDGYGAFYYTATNRAAFPVAGYDVLLRLRAAEDTSAAADELLAVLDKDQTLVRVRRGAELLIEVPLDSMLARLRDRSVRQRGGVAATLLNAEAENARAKASVWLRQVNGRPRGEGAEVTFAQGDVLVRVKR